MTINRSPAGNTSASLRRLDPGSMESRTTMTTVLAYLDPGSGSMILQIIAGGLAAVAVTAKLYWNRLLRFLHIKKDEPEAAKAEPAGSGD
jgi:hypothetical protein